MSKRVRIILVLLFVSLAFLVGFPLTKEGGEEGYADSHPQQSARCFIVGDTNGYITCLTDAMPRLWGIDLIKTAGHRLNLVLYPFGYLFIISLGMFVALACILI
ncbi:MAG: hypothetical protein ACYC6Z_11595 [Thermoleophilia bacterium]